MKKILTCAVLALSAVLMGCAPGATTGPNLAVPSVAAIADAVHLPHLTISGLTVTVHNPTSAPLTGDTSRNMRPVVTVLTSHAKPGPGSTCTRAESSDVRWNCPVANIAGGGTADLLFVADGTEGTSSVDFAFGTGYLGNAIVVPCHCYANVADDLRCLADVHRVCGHSLVWAMHPVSAARITDAVPCPVP